MEGDEAGYQKNNKKRRRSRSTMGLRVVVDGVARVLWLFGEDVAFLARFADMIWVWRLLPEESLSQRGRAPST
jgi:hypothetical protein